MSTRMEQYVIREITYISMQGSFSTKKNVNKNLEKFHFPIKVEKAKTWNNRKVFTRKQALDRSIEGADRQNSYLLDPIVIKVVVLFLRPTSKL